MESRCVACGRPLGGRDLKRCGYCGTMVPHSLRLTVRQRAFVARAIIEELDEADRGLPSEGGAMDVESGEAADPAPMRLSRRRVVLPTRKNANV